MNVKIKGVEIQCPEHVVGNDYYLEHFKSQGKDETAFFEKSGQKERLIANSGEETTVTLGIKATKKVLEKTGLTAQDIDMIVFTSQFPENTIPSQALQVHAEIKGKEDCLCFDLNANCVGMVVGLDVANNLMRAKPEIKRALVIGADYASKHCRDDSTIYAYFGDAGCATVLERIDEEDQWVGVAHSCDTTDSDIFFFPNCGLSNIYKQSIDKNDKKATIRHRETVSRESLGFRDFDKLFKECNVSIDDIKLFCVSQAALGNITAIRDRYNIPEEKIPYVGCKYGYTGTSSPFIVLYEAMKNGTVKEGDLVVLWSIGATYQSYGVLMRL